MGILARSLAVATVMACGQRHQAHSDAAVDATADACSSLGCYQFDCTPKGLPPTSISGTVYAPNGTLPLYGVNVYVPGSDPGPLPDGAHCDRCGDGLLGNPIAMTITDETGHFTLQNVPATHDVPVVIQVGKWRRQLKLPNVAACDDLPLVAADTTLPKSRTDLTPNTTSVDLPKIAITTGSADALECLPLKLGVAPEEISSDAGSGRIHLYTNPGGGQGALAFRAGWPDGAGAMGDARTMWGSLDNLKPYDIVIFSCEGGQFPASRPQAAMQAVHDYADLGGRVFMSHWHNIWIGGEINNPAHGLADWEAVATWSFAGDPNPDTRTATIDETGNPKGVSFATWMLNVMGSTTRDLIPVTQARDTCSAVTTKGERWVYFDPATSPMLSSATNFQFTTPQQMPPDQRCGKVVFSDMHVSAGSSSSKAVAYPNGCSMAPLTPQEKALAFMFFDIASCVGNIP